MTIVNALDLFVIAVWVLGGFPVLAWGFWSLRKYNRTLKDLDAALDERRSGRTP
jgi:positive regulator of sigma E activity